MNTGKSDILIILDLDETLIHSAVQPLKINHNYKLDKYFVYKRPYLDEFLAYISKNFRLAIWSSGSDSYVLNIVEWLGLLQMAEFVWGRSKTTHKLLNGFNQGRDSVNPSADQNNDIKRLKKVKKLGYSLEKILIIDDTPYKSHENYGNAIYISEFTGNPDDQELKLLMSYLETIKFVNNVREIEKRGWRERAIES